MGDDNTIIVFGQDDRITGTATVSPPPDPQPVDADTDEGD